MRPLLGPLYRATKNRVYSTDGSTPAGNIIDADGGPWMYAGAPTGRATDIVPAISVTWLPTPDRSVQRVPVHESAL